MNVKKIIILSVFIFFLFITNFANFEVKADACDGLGIDEKIECLKKETEKLNSQSKTLSTQISQFDAQIKLTTLKVFRRPALRSNRRFAPSAKLIGCNRRLILWNL
jgi:peptidoglycan hydrolase CwlO-like protein